MALGIPWGIQICHVVKTINTGGYCIYEREICCVCRNLYPWKQYRDPYIRCKCGGRDFKGEKSRSGK